MATLLSEHTRQATPPGSKGQRILLATDASPEARAATAVAMKLADDASRELRAVSIVEPFYFGVPEMSIGMQPADLERSRMAARSEEVRGELDKVNPGRDIPIEVRLGLPGATIAREAELGSDGLVILGLGRHRLTDRLMGRETALQATRFGSTPVLAVPPDSANLPRVAVVAVDFSEHSLRAARAAVELLPTLGWIYLVHVAPNVAENGDHTLHLERFGQSLEVGEHATLQSVTLNGDDVAESILRFSALAHADVVVAGAHGRGFFARLVHGSVSTSIIRGAASMVLIVPPPPAAPAVMPSSGDAASWTDTLVEFNERNIGRTCTLEVDDPLIGAQVQAVGYALLGADYDHTDGRVELMLGSMDGSGAHLTRNIPGVRALDSVRRESGVETLRVSHDLGQTLLTVH
jgi:nucleotide-binding universal stress UspA family protein